MRRRRRAAAVQVPEWVRYCVAEHWSDDGDPVDALLTWLAACLDWEERTGAPVWDVWQPPHGVFGPIPAEEVPDVAPPPPDVLDLARGLRQRKVVQPRASQ